MLISVCCYDHAMVGATPCGLECPQGAPGVCMTTKLLVLCLCPWWFFCGFQSACQTGNEETQLEKFVVTSHSVTNPLPDHTRLILAKWNMKGPGPKGVSSNVVVTGTPPQSCWIFRQSNNKLIIDSLFQLSLVKGLPALHIQPVTPRLHLRCKRSQAKRLWRITPIVSPGGWSSYITVGAKARKRKTSVHVVSCKRCFYSTVSVTAARDSLIWSHEQSA